MRRSKSHEKRKPKTHKSDRLSSLPDDVLCHILSFLPTKFSVATSILARRYRSLWTDVSDIDFDCNNHVLNRRGMSFTDTVSRVMFLSNVRELNRFRLILIDRMFDEKHLFESWIRAIIARNVKALDIRLYHNTCLPQCIFTCKTLVDMRLHCCGSIPDSVILLPNLKRLHLHSIPYFNFINLHTLISGCPVLEELNIHTTVRQSELKSCIISSSTMKRLSLSFDYCYKDYKLQINTPALRYLNLQKPARELFSTGTFNSLVEATICLDDDIYSDSVFGFVENLYQVQCLKFDWRAFSVASFAATTSKFINLTRLELGAHWNFLLKFLESADNLQVLIIEKVEFDAMKCWTEPQQVPKCLSSHLKQVTIQQFQNLDDEFEMISYILRNSEVLNIMEIHAQNENAALTLDALRRIIAFERGSRTCKIEFI